MPDRAKHEAQARANLDLAERLLTQWPNDPWVPPWAATLAFYCAVHCIEAHLADIPIHTVDHADRDRVIRADGVQVPRHVRYAYYDLKGISRDARYEIRMVTAAYVRIEVLGKLLPRVRVLIGL